MKFAMKKLTYEIQCNISLSYAIPSNFTDLQFLRQEELIYNFLILNIVIPCIL